MDTNLAFECTRQPPVLIVYVYRFLGPLAGSVVARDVTA